MKKLSVVILLTFLSFSAVAQNMGSGYAAFGGGLLTFDDGFDALKPKQLFGRLGYDFNPHIGIGVEGSFSLIEDDLLGVDFDVSTVFFYLKGALPVGDGNRIYGMIGSTNVELTGTASGPFGDVSVSVDDNDTGMGLGFEASNGFSVDYIIYNDNDGVEVTSFNIGFNSRF